MKITDIIRSVLDIIDHAEKPQPEVTSPEMSVQIAVPAVEPDDLARLKQIAGLVDKSEQQYSNSPAEKVADIDAVTGTGTDVHKSKHPADIRSDSVSMFPFYQARPNGE